MARAPSLTNKHVETLNAILDDELTVDCDRKEAKRAISWLVRKHTKLMKTKEWGIWWHVNVQSDFPHRFRGAWKALEKIAGVSGTMPEMDSMSRDDMGNKLLDERDRKRHLRLTKRQEKERRKTEEAQERAREKEPTGWWAEERESAEEEPEDLWDRYYAGHLLNDDERMQIVDAFRGTTRHHLGSTSHASPLHQVLTPGRRNEEPPEPPPTLAPPIPPPTGLTERTILIDTATEE